jgi:hypothetical protein
MGSVPFAPTCAKKFSSQAIELSHLLCTSYHPRVELAGDTLMGVIAASLLVSSMGTAIALSNTQQPMSALTIRPRWRPLSLAMSDSMNGKDPRKQGSEEDEAACEQPSDDPQLKRTHESTHSGDELGSGNDVPLEQGGARPRTQ